MAHDIHFNKYHMDIVQGSKLLGGVVYPYSLVHGLGSWRDQDPEFPVETLSGGDFGHRAVGRTTI